MFSVSSSISWAFAIATCHEVMPALEELFPSWPRSPRPEKTQGSSPSFSPVSISIGPAIFPSRSSANDCKCTA